LVGGRGGRPQRTTSAGLEAPDLAADAPEVVARHRAERGVPAEEQGRASGHGERDLLSIQNARFPIRRALVGRLPS
jgi:hypothetical protein